MKTELPIGYNVLDNNSDEKKAMIDLLEKLPSRITSRMEHLMSDRGYDSTEMIRAAKAAGIIPIVDIRNCRKDGEATKQYKDTDIVYDFKGNVYMVDDKGEQRRMHYEGYDRQKQFFMVIRIALWYTDDRLGLPL